MLSLCKDKTISAFPKLKTSAKSVQTTAEVCADYTCSLYRLQLKSPESTTYLQKYLRVLTETSTSYLQIYPLEYDFILVLPLRVGCAIAPFFEPESFLYVFILYLCRQLSESSNTDSEVILCRVMGN